MMLRGSADDWMLPQEGGGEGASTSDAYRMGGLAGMENYVEGHPELIYKAYDKAQRNKALRAALPEINQKPLVDLSGGIPLDQQLQADKQMARFIVPQGPGDALTSLILPLKGIGLGAKALTGGAGHAFDSTEAEAHSLTPRQAMLRRKQRAMGGVGEGAADDFNPRAVIGGNAPPPAMRIAPEAQPAAASTVEALNVPTIPAMTPKQAETAWISGLPRPQPAARSTEIPNLREMTVEQAVEQARKQSHLIKSGEGSEGAYVGGPREIQSKAALNKVRRDFDAYVAADPRGADWYDRYRAGLNEITGGNKLHNEWASKQHGQWSAGVDPGGEAHFVLKENNAALMGMPVKAARPAQHEAFMEAIAANDPNKLQLGDKTWEYATKVTPDQVRPAGATGVNDFRHARNFKYTEKSGEPQKGALGDAGHRFLDYETALAVDRANQAMLGGRNDWTGEKLQAAPWVRQKALDIMSRNPKLTYEEAILRANTTLADYLGKHTYSATHEAQPGKNTGHMMGSIAAPQAEKDEFFRDRRSTWATAPGGRDAIYAGMQLGDTGVAGRVRPTVPMQGYYQNPDGTIERNLGEVARPLGTFDTPRTYDKEFVGPREFEPFKRATKADQAMLNAGEGFRAWMDAQNAGSWNKLWFGGPAGESNTLFYPRPQGGMASIADMQNVQGASTKYGLPDVLDTGAGTASTRFWPPPENSKELSAAIRKGEFGALGLGTPMRARMDSNLLDYTEEWGKGEGSGEATRKMLAYITGTPEIKAAFNNNPLLAEQALAKIARDEDWAKRWGPQRQDIINARKIVAAGPGWVDRLEDALKTGAVSLPAVAAMLGAASELQGGDRAEQ